MMRSRVLFFAACAAISASVLGAGCSSSGDDEGVRAARTTTQAASVSLVLHDENGTRIGHGSGILIAPRVVLTSGHLVSGKARWTVTSADGKTRVTGIRGLTYDWMRYDSSKAHPRKHDVGILYLDRPITLAAYPKIASEAPAGGSTATRIRGTGNGFERIEAKLEKLRSSPHAYLAALGRGETLDTGGAVLDDRSEIVGVVSGRGMTTGKLYIARLGDLATWLSPKIACGSASPVSLATRTYGTPPPKPGCEDDGAGTGTPPGDGSGGGYDKDGNPTPGGGYDKDGSQVPAGGNGSSSSGGGYDSSGNPTPGGGYNKDGSQVPAGGSGTGDDESTTDTGDGVTDGSCADGGGVCSGACGPNAGSDGSIGSPPAGAPGGAGGYDANGNPTAGGGYNEDGSQVPAGGSGAASSGAGYDASGNPTAGGGHNKDGSQVPAGGGGGHATQPGSAGYDGSGKPADGGGYNQDGSQVPAGGGGGAGGYDANGNPSAGGGHNADGSTVPAGGSGTDNSSTVPGSSTSKPGEGEACSGPSDNPDVCPPEADGCTGPQCGGGQPDDSIDYGGCGTCGDATSSDDAIFLR